MAEFYQKTVIERVEIKYVKTSPWGVKLYAVMAGSQELHPPAEMAVIRVWLRANRYIRQI